MPEACLALLCRPGSASGSTPLTYVAGNGMGAERHCRTGAGHFDVVVIKKRMTSGELNSHHRFMSYETPPPTFRTCHLPFKSAFFVGGVSVLDITCTHVQICIYAHINTHTLNHTHFYCHIHTHTYSHTAPSTGFTLGPVSGSSL